MTISRPVQQIQNPVKAPEFVQWAAKLRRTTKDRFANFCEENDYTMQDVLDAALLDYMDLHARTNDGQIKEDGCAEEEPCISGNAFFDHNGEPIAEVP